MTALPNTKTRGAGRRWPLYVIVAVALVALALVVEAFLRAEKFTPGEEISSPSIRDVSVSAENRLYPPPDVDSFEGRPRKVFVYLNVKDLSAGEDLGARVHRSGSDSAFSFFFGRDNGIEVSDEQEDQLTSGGEGGGASGIVKFALKTRSGEPLPPGNYTVEISSLPGGSGGRDGSLAVRKLFVIDG